MVGRLPNSASGLSSVELQNRSLDVKSAVIIYIAVHLSHECTRFGIGGISLEFEIYVRENCKGDIPRK